MSRNRKVGFRIELVYGCGGFEQAVNVEKNGLSGLGGGWIKPKRGSYEPRLLSGFSIGQHPRILCRDHTGVHN